VCVWCVYVCVHANIRRDADALRDVPVCLVEEEQEAPKLELPVSAVLQCKRNLPCLYTVRVAIKALGVCVSECV
jgi:hypothetical protein